MRVRGQLSEDPAAEFQITRCGARTSYIPAHAGVPRVHLTVEFFLYIYIHSTPRRTVPPSDRNGHSANDIKRESTYYPSDDDIERAHVRYITCVFGPQEWCVMRSERIIWTDKLDSRLLDPNRLTH